MNKKERILNLVLQHLDNMSDEELYNAFMNKGKYEVHSIDYNIMRLEIKGIKIILKEQIALYLQAKYYYSIDFYCDKYLTIYDKRIKIYFDRLRKYINKINIEEKNKNIENILSRLQS